MNDPTTDVDQLVQVLRQSHCWAKDASVELEYDVELAATDGLTVGRGTRFALANLSEVVDWLEELADLLADHFGVVFLHEAPEPGSEVDYDNSIFGES